MSNTSIDGLRRNNGVKKATASRAQKRKTLEVPTKKKELKAHVQANKQFEPAKKEEKRSQEQAVKEFFNIVKDENPTDLVDVPKKERKKKRKKKHKILRRVILVLVLLILAGGVIVYCYFNDFIAKVTDGGSLLGFLTSDPDTPLQKDTSGRTNILIFGTEGFNMEDPQYDGGFLTDSMMLLSIDQETGDAKAINLPRDLKAKTCTSTSKLNEVYFCSYNYASRNTEEERRKAEAEAARKLATAFEEVLGVKIQYRVHANWGAVTRIVDAIGGIDVVFTYGDQTWDGDETVIKTTSPKGLADNYRNGKYGIQYPNGEVVHLGGWQALGVARVRNAHGGYGAANGNFSREYFQQRVLEAIVSTAKKKNITSDLIAVMKIKDAVGDNLRTDFKDTEIKTLLKLANTVNFAKLETLSLTSTDDKPSPLMTTGTINGISYVLPTAGVGNYTNIHAYIKRKFSAEPFTEENAQIAVLNGTSAYGIASKEKTTLEDKGYVVKSTGNAPSDQSGFDGVRIYQKNTKLTKTAEALKKLYKVDIIKEIPDSLKNTEADFIVIVGNGASRSK